MTEFSAVALAGVLFLSILLASAPPRWAISLLEVSSFALAAAWAVRLAIRPLRLQRVLAIFPLAGTVLWGILQLSMGWSIYPRETWNALLMWTTNLAVFAVTLQVLSDARIRGRFLRATLLFGFTVSVVSALAMFTSRDHVFWVFPVVAQRPPSGPFLSPNQYAAFIELVLPLALVGAASDTRKVSPFALMAGAMYASVIASASRAGFLLTSLEILAVLALALGANGGTLHRAARMVAVLAASIVLFTVVVGPEALWDRLRRPDPYAGRREMLDSTLEMIRDRAWTGFGLGTWSTAYPGYARYDDGLFANHAHNDWAQWTAEGGFPFLALLVGIAVWSLRPALRSRWGIGVTAVFLHCLVDYPLQKPALAAFFFALLAALACSAKDPKMRLDSVIETYTILS
jgi:O-antigen ligase